MLIPGSGQTNGLPLVLTALAAASAQLLHTAPAGSGTPHAIDISAINNDPTGGAHSVTLLIKKSDGTLISTIAASIPASPAKTTVVTGLILNGSATISAFTDSPSAVALTASISDQANVAGSVSTPLCSGLVAAVINASRYAMGAQGGTGQATIANAQWKAPRAGVIRNFRSSADAAVGTTAVVTAGIYVNGVLSSLSNTHANADGTADKVNTGAIAVAAGDLITFGFATTNVAPAANMHGAAEFV